VTIKIQDIIRWIALPVVSAAVCASGGMIFLGLKTLLRYVEYTRCVGGIGCALSNVLDIIVWFALGWLLSIIPVWFLARAVSPKYKRTAATIAAVVFGIVPAWLMIRVFAHA
jgi:hypothetical protein